MSRTRTAFGLLAAGAVLGLGVIGVTKAIESFLQRRYATTCHSRMLILGLAVSVQLATFEPPTPLDRDRLEPPIVTISRLDNLVPWNNICPAERRTDRSLRYEDCTPEVLSYDSWSMEELCLLLQNPQGGGILIWEKHANHGGKRHVYEYGYAVLLLDDATFASRMEQTRAILEDLKAKEKSQESSGDAHI